MKILFSYPLEIPNEIELINKLMIDNNWDAFHLRKPLWDEKKIYQLYNQLNNKVKEKTIFHKKFNASCHSFEEVELLNGKKDYCFLSPIFDSISKEGYQSKFKKEELKKFLTKKRAIKVIALGGITSKNYNEVLNLGFDGAAFLGSIWNNYE